MEIAQVANLIAQHSVAHRMTTAYLKKLNEPCLSRQGFIFFGTVFVQYYTKEKVVPIFGPL